MFPNNICQNIDILVIINVWKNDFGFLSNRKTQGHKHQIFLPLTVYLSLLQILATRRRNRLCLQGHPKKARSRRRNCTRRSSTSVIWPRNMPVSFPPHASLGLRIWPSSDSEFWISSPFFFNSEMEVTLSYFGRGKTLGRGWSQRHGRVCRYTRSSE